MDINNMDDIVPAPLLDKFVEELPDEYAVSLKEYSWFIGHKLYEVMHENMRGWYEGMPVPIVYLFQAGILRIFELGMTLTEALVSENVAAAQIVKNHVKEKVAKW